MINEIELYGDGIGKVQHIDHMSDLTIANSARVSFGVGSAELDKRDKRLVNYLVKHKHTSTFEHNVITFKFTVPFLFIRSQHHRHRTWSYNEISRRYTDKDLRFYEPTEFRSQHKSNRQASNPDDTCNPMLEMYSRHAQIRSLCWPQSDFKSSQKLCQAIDDLLDAGICREQGGVLPQNLYTEYYGTVNLNNLLKFVDLRIHEGAQWEIQRVAEACQEMAEQLWPVAVSSFKSRNE